jgi:hypothetical protein
MPRTTNSAKKMKKVDHDMLVEVMNGASGVLVYKNPRTGAAWRFDRYGARDLMPVQELITIRSQYPRFFEDQWLIVLDEDVINYLRLDQFYKDVLTPDELEAFFDKDAKEIEEYLKTASNGAKALIAGRARKLYEEGVLTDIFKIRAINKMIGVHIAEDDFE